MERKREILPDNLIMAIIIHIYIGWGFLYLVKFAVNHLTNNAFMGLFLAAVIMIPFFWIAADFSRIFPGMGITAIFNRTFGNGFGKVLGVIFGLFITFYEIIMLRDAHLMIYTYFFKKTPFFLVVAFTLAIALYVALKGLKSIGRLAGFMLLPPLLIILLLELLGLSNVNWLNIRPVLAGSLWQWFSAGTDLTLIFVPGSAIFFYTPFMKHPKENKKISFYSLSVVFPVFFLALLGTIGVFGPPLTKKLSWSVVEFFHVIDFPYLLLEQAGLFFLIAWFAIFFVSITQGLFLIGSVYNFMFPQIKLHWYIIAISILVFIGVNIPINIINLESFLHRYQKWIAFSYLGLLLGTWLAARLRFEKGAR